MTIQRVLSRVLLFSVLLPSAVFPKTIPVAEFPPDFPGQSKGVASSRWIAPYVIQHEIQVGDTAIISVVWYSRSGDILKSISGRWIAVDPSGIREVRQDSIWVHSIHDTSTIVLPGYKPATGPDIFGRSYGKFIDVKYVKPGGEFTDYYVSGKFVGTYGPHQFIVGQEFIASQTGSFAYTIKCSPDRSCHQIVVADSGGIEVFDFVADGTPLYLYPSPNGGAVVMNYNGGEKDRLNSRDYACFFAAGDTVRMDRVNCQIRMLDWVPGSYKMIAVTRYEEREFIRLIDWRTGETLWETEDPIEYGTYSPSCDYAVTDSFFVMTGLAVRHTPFGSAAMINSTPRTIRMMAAIDMETGKVVAKWFEPMISPHSGLMTLVPTLRNFGGNLIWYGDEVYYVVDERFSALDFDDIREHRNNWVAPRDSGNVYYNVCGSLVPLK